MYTRLSHLLLVIIPAVTSSPAAAQSPLDSFAFKGTHNSYELPISLDDQIDNYNTWCIELDVCCRSGSPDYHICVRHGDDPPDYPLDELLAEVVAARAWSERVVFLWLDIKHDDPCDRWPAEWPDGVDWPDGGWVRLLQSRLDAVFPAGSVYTHEEFEAVDGGAWPSLRALRERGYHLIPILDGGHWEAEDHGVNDKPNDRYFFVTAESVHEANQHGAWWVAFINCKDGSCNGGEEPAPDDRYLWRAWNLDDSDEFGAAVQRGFNLVCTDHYDANWTFHESLHPPVPLVVDAGSGCDPDDGEFGTWAFPFESVAGGVNRACPYTTVLVEAGSYPESITIDKPLTLLASGGTVTIGQ